MKKKIVFIVLLVFASIFCFSEKWRKEPVLDSWGEEIGTNWITFAQIVNTGGTKDLKAVGVVYGKFKKGPELFAFYLAFNYIAPFAYEGYIEVKDGPKVYANEVEYAGDSIYFYPLLTLEQYRKSYEGKLVKLQWANGEYVTIKAPVWEE